jgi:hypothetical protein
MKSKFYIHHSYAMGVAARVNPIWKRAKNKNTEATLLAVRASVGTLKLSKIWLIEKINLEEIKF